MFAIALRASSRSFDPAAFLEAHALELAREDLAQLADLGAGYRVVAQTDRSPLDLPR